MCVERKRDRERVCVFVERKRDRECVREKER